MTYFFILKITIFMTNKIVLLDNSVQFYEHYVDDAKWERTLSFPRGGVTYLVSNSTIKFYAYKDYLYKNCLISMQLPIRVVDEFEHIDGEFEDIDELAEVLDRIFPTNDLDAELADYLRVKDAELLYQPIGDYALKSEIPDVSNFVTDEELVDALDLYVEKEGFNSYTAETASVIQELDNRKADKSELSPYFDGAEYDSETREIKFYHNGVVKTQIDATPFIKDGMVNSVRLENGYLIVTFNTDAGKEPISIEIGSIFEPSNYYTKAEVDNIANGKADANDVYTKSETDSKFQLKGNYVSANTFISYTATTNAALANKAERSEIPDMTQYYTKSETSGSSEIQDALDLKADKSDTYTKAQVDEKIGEGGQFDPNRYYTKVEASDNFQPIGNYVSASTYTSFTSTTEASIQTLRGTKLDISAYTPSDLSDYYTKGEVYSKGETYNRNEIDDKIIQSGNFDPTRYYTKGDSDSRFALKDEMPSLSGYATEDWVTSKNYATKAELVMYVNNLQQQINSLMATVSGCCGTQEDVYRWLTIIGEYLCDGNDKYEKQKYQVSHDSGINWEDVTPIQYQKGQLIESNSEDCGYAPEPQYRWQKADTSDYMCSGTSKYYKLYYQVSTDGGQTWENVSPEQTKIGGLIESNSSDCGYVTPQYRWLQAPSTDYICSGTTKHFKEYYQVSTDGGKTWENVSPEQTRTSIDIIETNSTDCGYIEPMYRIWSGTPYCNGYDKVVYTKNQVSYDNGSTWQDTGIIGTSVVEHNSSDCGYQNYKVKVVNLSYTPSGTYDKEYFIQCNSSNYLSSGETTTQSNQCKECSAPWPSGFFESGDRAVYFGNCLTTIGAAAFKHKGASHIYMADSIVRIEDEAFYSAKNMGGITWSQNIEHIGEYAFTDCWGLKTLNIPNSIKRIGERAFSLIGTLRTVTIGSGITSFGEGVFAECAALTSFTITAPTPPTFRRLFYGTNSGASTTYEYPSGLKIYVPADKVLEYKDAWNPYADIIYPIS